MQRIALHRQRVGEARAGGVELADSRQPAAVAWRTTTTFHTVVGNTTVTAGEWVRLRTTYDFVFSYQSLTLYVESASGTASFLIDDFDLTFVPPPVAERDIASVHEAFSNDFPVGAAVWQGDLAGEHAFLLSKHFNSVTSENDMKWGTLQPTEGTFTFANADAQVAFAKAHNQAVRGHTLVWHDQNPAWLFTVNGAPMTPTPENKAHPAAAAREPHPRRRRSLRRRRVCVGRGERGDRPGAGRRVPAQPWFNITGTEYIERAFRVAREVAPNARLYINDFGTTDEPKRSFLLSLVRDLLSRGVPIDGIGHQMHSNIEYPSAAAVITTLNLFTALGLDNQITELDVSIYSNTFPQPFTAYEDIPADRFVRQAFKYRDLFRSFRYLSGDISSVTLWGQADDHTWLTSSARVNAPLLFDTGLKHKLAYTAIMNPSELPGAGSTAVVLGRVHRQAGSRARPSHGCGDARVEQQRTVGDDELQLQRSVDEGAVHQHGCHHLRCDAVGSRLAGRFHRRGHERRRGGLHRHRLRHRRWCGGLRRRHRVDHGPHADRDADLLRDRCRVRG